MDIFIASSRLGKYPPLFFTNNHVTSFDMVHFRFADDGQTKPKWLPRRTHVQLKKTLSECFHSLEVNAEAAWIFIA